MYILVLFQSLAIIIAKLEVSKPPLSNTGPLVNNDRVCDEFVTIRCFPTCGII